MQNVVLIPNREKDPGLEKTKQAAQILRESGLMLYADEAYKNELSNLACYYTNIFEVEKPDLLLVLGGDGSVLRAAQTAIALDAPILGINLGRLGFLNDLELERMGDLSLLKEGKYTEKHRMVLDIAIVKEGRTEPLPIKALNDVILSGNGHLLDMQLEQHGFCTVDYRADGMVIATPSGSTAYTLSAGGPVIDDRMDAICVTPICPRSFFARSVLFCPEDILTLRNTSLRIDEVALIADGNHCGTLSYGDAVEIRRSEKRLRTITFESHSTMRVLQRKMNMQNF